MDKAALRDYRMLVWEVQQLREQLATLESSLYSPRGQRFSVTPRAPSAEKSTMDNAVARHINLEQKYREKLEAMEAQQLAIEEAIESLGDTPERVIMRELYIKGKRWPAVLYEMQKRGYSERTAYRLHGLALLKLKEV